MAVPWDVDAEDLLKLRIFDVNTVWRQQQGPCRIVQEVNDEFSVRRQIHHLVRWISGCLTERF